MQAGVCAKKEVWERYSTPNEKTAPNSSNKMSIRLKAFPHWIFLCIYAVPGATRRNVNDKPES